jgi:hypothetical protein
VMQFTNRYLDYIELNGRLSDKQWIRKDWEGSCRHLTEVLPQHFSGRIEEYHEETQSGQPMTWSRFKSNTSRVRDRSGTAAPSCSVEWLMKTANTRSQTIG